MKKNVFLFIAFFIAQRVAAQSNEKLDANFFTKELSDLQRENQVERWYESMKSSHPSYIENGLHRVLIKMKSTVLTDDFYRLGWVFVYDNEIVRIQTHYDKAFSYCKTFGKILKGKAIVSIKDYILNRPLKLDPMIAAYDPEKITVIFVDKIQPNTYVKPKIELGRLSVGIDLEYNRLVRYLKRGGSFYIYVRHVEEGGPWFLCGVLDQDALGTEPCKDDISHRTFYLEEGIYEFTVIPSDLSTFGDISWTGSKSVSSGNCTSVLLNLRRE